MDTSRFELAKDLILQVGIILHNADFHALSVETKTGLQDIVTKYDKGVEAFLQQKILSDFPSDAIIGEEFPPHRGSSYTWYIDPIDGTSNFVSQRHDYCVSIACYCGEKPVFGLVLDVERGALYSAISGQGAWRGTEPIRCAQYAPVQNLLLTTPVVPALFLHGHPMRESFCRLANEVRAVRSKGCVSLEICLVAAGEADVFAARYAGPWDHAAAQIILREAGGACCTFCGHPLPLEGNTTILAASSEQVLAEMRHYLNSDTENRT